MVEAVMFWNEPNNKSHWDPDLDPGWATFASLVAEAAAAVKAAAPAPTRVLGGISPIDPGFITNMASRHALDDLDAIGVHGFPLDWNHWPIHEWPERLREIQDVTALPVWVSEAGASSFGAEEVQDFGLERTLQLLAGRTPRLHWYSLFDLPAAWPATTRHREAEGSSYYRHFHMGLIDEHGREKIALRRFAGSTPSAGLCQWFHFEDARLDDAVRWMRRLGVTYLRTGLSWADSLRPGAEQWFDHQMRALEPFSVTLTYCFTPESCGVRPHHTSPPREIGRYAEFCARMTARYAA